MDEWSTKCIQFVRIENVVSTRMACTGISLSMIVQKIVKKVAKKTSMVEPLSSLY